MNKNKILLVAINAKYIHTNIAVRYLKEYADKKTKSDITISEFTINQYVTDILSEIYDASPDIIGFSCYIWNIEHIKKLISLIRKVFPNTKIFLGGPEVSYKIKEAFNELKPDFIIFGEGEKTFLDFVSQAEKPFPDYSQIKGLAYNDNENFIMNPPRTGIDMTLLPFPYTESDFVVLKNKIMYYEASRGCPFLCQYCLSSIEHGVRYSPIEKVKKELKIFLNKKVPQVKFVDRTFNSDKTFALQIINFIIENDNGITNFHFEAAAELLGTELLDALTSSRKGLFQLEIGVQSTNIETLNIIKRNSDFKRIKNCTEQLRYGNNINLHLDLIAGLPKENYESFKRSYNDVFALRPHQLQLGFLKLLKGSGMEKISKDHGIICSPYPPYEVLETDCLTFAEILCLKQIEDLTEIYYNSRRFIYSVEFLLEYSDSPFEFFEKLSKYRNKKCAVSLTNNKRYTYAFLYQFCKENDYNSERMKWIIKFDMLLHENMKTNPDWLDIRNTDETNKKISDFYIHCPALYDIIPEYAGMHPKQTAKQTHIERFPFNPITGENKETFLLFNYLNRDINGNASTTEVSM